MQPRPEDAMEELEAEAAPKAAAGPELGFWLTARRRLTPDGPFLRRRSPPPLEPAPTPCLNIVARHLDEEKSSNPIGNMTILPFLA